MEKEDMRMEEEEDNGQKQTKETNKVRNRRELIQVDEEVRKTGLIKMMLRACGMITTQAS